LYRYTKGCAFLDFASVEDARQAMEYPYRDKLELAGRRLVLEYARTEQRCNSGVAAQNTINNNSNKSGGGSYGMDWICCVNGCSTVNFSWRYACFTCNLPRPDDAVLVEKKMDLVRQKVGGRYCACGTLKKQIDTRHLRRFLSEFLSKL
jgi:hypothetical protein